MLEDEYQTRKAGPCDAPPQRFSNVQPSNFQHQVIITVLAYLAQRVQVPRSNNLMQSSRKNDDDGLDSLMKELQSPSSSSSSKPLPADPKAAVTTTIASSSAATPGTASKHKPSEDWDDWEEGEDQDGDGHRRTPVPEAKEERIQFYQDDIRVCNTIVRLR